MNINIVPMIATQSSKLLMLEHRCVLHIVVFTAAQSKHIGLISAQNVIRSNLMLLLSEFATKSAKINRKDVVLNLPSKHDSI